MLKKGSFQKKISGILIATFLVMISSFLFTNSISALEAHNINDLDLFSEEITEDYLYETYGVSKDAFPYVVMFASENSVISGRYEVYLFFMTENDNLGLRDYESGGVFFCSFYGDFAYYTWTSTNAITEEIDLANYTINYKSGASKGTWRGSKSKDDFYYFSNFDILTLNNPETNNLSDINITTDVYLPANNVSTTFNITTIDSELGYEYGVNYTIGEQENTVEFYIQDSGILLDAHAKGYEIDKIYYDESLTQEALMTDILESDTNLYVKWKSKISISSIIATDLSGNDVITLKYDFSKIYNENYTYWVSTDGTNYTEITNSLNSDYFYNTGVYFSGIYYARVQDENSQTISVSYIDIDYYRITPNTIFGNDMDNNGNLKPYVILDYSSYYEIKDQIICEYSIDNGNSWIDITDRLDENLKYKLYINIGDKITSRVRTVDTVIFPNTSFGSSYDVDEEFYNNIIDSKQQSDMQYSFDSFLKPIKFIFDSITDFYNNYCPEIVQNFIFVSFTFVVIIVLIKLFL